MLGMNSEQQNLMIRQLVAIVVGPALTAYGITAVNQPAYVNVLATIAGGLITLGGMIYSQYKTRNAGLVNSAATVSKEALNADPKMASIAAVTAAKVEGTTVVTKPEVANAAPAAQAANVISNTVNKVVAQ